MCDGLLWDRNVNHLQVWYEWILKSTINDVWILLRSLLDYLIDRWILYINCYRYSPFCDSHTFVFNNNWKLNKFWNFLKVQVWSFCAFQRFFVLHFKLYPTNKLLWLYGRYWSKFSLRNHTAGKLTYTSKKQTFLSSRIRPYLGQIQIPSWSYFRLFWPELAGH